MDSEFRMERWDGIQAFAKGGEGHTSMNKRLQMIIVAGIATLLVVNAIGIVTLVKATNESSYQYGYQYGKVLRRINICIGMSCGLDI